MLVAKESDDRVIADLIDLNAMILTISIKLVTANYSQVNYVLRLLFHFEIFHCFHLDIAAHVLPSTH